jgi:hypothetical protein
VPTVTHYNYFRDYDPAIGSYVQSDPIGLRGGLNTFAYVYDSPLRYTDPKGLAIWLCNRRVNLWPLIDGGIGNHAYIWNDKKGLCCGRNTGRDPLNSCMEKGPFGGDSCIKLSDSDGKEDDIMSCCQRTANERAWFPWWNDCHDSADRCLTASGVSNPGAAGGRLFGSCSSCWATGNESAPRPSSARY